MVGFCLAPAAYDLGELAQNLAFQPSLMPRDIAPHTAPVYSHMLPCVILSLRFGNIIFETIIPLSVTRTIRQFVSLKIFR